MWEDKYISSSLMLTLRWTFYVWKRDTWGRKAEIRSILPPNLSGVRAGEKYSLKTAFLQSFHQHTEQFVRAR